MYSKALPVSDTDSSECESCWAEPHDGVFCNVVECNDTTTSRRPAERRKMSLSLERKEKDGREKKKKSPLKVLMCGLAVDQPLYAKSLCELKCTYFITHPAKQDASHLAAVCLQSGRV